MFRERRIEPEILDHVSPEEARPNLADLVRINRRFGGHHVLRQSLQDIDAKQDSTFLDIGAASGDSGRLIKEMYSAARVVSLDLHPTNLEKAEVPKLLADAFALPFREASFDYVLCSLFLHHFEDEQVVALLKSFYRLARRALIVTDLERHVLPYLFLPATRHILGWNRITVDDGVKSVRAAFRERELAVLAKRAGLQKITIKTYRPAFRIALSARR
jgi:ubiquinone/menaquinone biosynthesis C-methylase UbiE